MTQSKWIVFGWSIFFTTLAFAAPKSKQGSYAYSPKYGKAVKIAPHQTTKSTKTTKQVYRPKFKAEPQATEVAGADAVIYKAQKFASEMTQEVGYLLKSTGPWLKEIEDQIRGVDQAPPPVVVKSHDKQRNLLATKQSTAAAPAGKAHASISGLGRHKAEPKRQLGQMSQSPNQILDTVVQFSKDTWDKVHLVVADLMGQSDSQ